VVYDYTDPVVPIETPQPPVPVTPPTPVDPGNPSAIQPPLDPWNAVKHVLMPNGVIFCYEVPGLHGGTGINFTQGQDANTKGGCFTEYSISQTPGVIDPNGAAGGYYLKSGSLNNNGIVINRAGTAMPYCPEGQVWYINIRWTNPTGAQNGFSVQWVAAA
jgi:hypothetical protein